jgi:hypothetical protein
LATGLLEKYYGKLKEPFKDIRDEKFFYYIDTGDSDAYFNTLKKLLP